MLAPKFTETECHELPDGEKKKGFDAPQCVREICGEKLNQPVLRQEELDYVVGCALGGVIQVNTQVCTTNSFVKHYPEIKTIAQKMKSFYHAELKLTGHRIGAAVNFMKDHENPNSPLDNFGLNIMDLFAFVKEHPDLVKTVETEEGISLQFKNPRRIKRKLRWRFRLKRGSEDEVALKAMKAIFEDSNSLIALEFLGPDYVMKNLMNERGIKENPDEALRKMKFDSLAVLKALLGEETIDPEYIRGTPGELSVDRTTLLTEVLLLQNLTKSLSARDIRTLSKSNFAKKRFYNRPKFGRDWSDPDGKTYLNTLQHLQELQRIYVGDEEIVRDHDVYPFLIEMLHGLKLLPEKEKLEEVKKKVPAFMDKFFENFAKEFSSDSTGIIKGAIGELHINYPETREEFLKKVENWLDYKKSLADETLKQLRDKTNKKAIAFHGREYLQSLIMGGNADGALSQITPLVAVNPIPDFYIGAYNGIKMGPFAVNEFDGAGKQVLAHELSHHIGHFMEENPLSKDTTGKFKVLRQCLASSHKDGVKKVKVKVKSLKNKTHRWNENFYTEEDFSDWVAAKTSDSNFACQFVKNMDFSQYEKMEDLFVNANKKDPHSSGFYRLINMELHQKGSLPESCQNNFVKKCPESQDK